MVGLELEGLNLGSLGHSVALPVDGFNYGGFRV